MKDMHGHLVWRVRVAPREMTCLVCGDTFVEGHHCVPCYHNDDGSVRRKRPPSVPTVSYLREGEYELVR